MVRLLSNLRENILVNGTSNIIPVFKNVITWLRENNLKLKFLIMAKASRPINAPSTTGNPSGGGRGNNPPSSPKPATKGK